VKSSSPAPPVSSGTHLVHRLVGAGGRVVGAAASVEDPRRLSKISDQITLENIDLSQEKPLKEFFSSHRFSAIFHLAAAGVRAGLDNTSTVINTNVLGTVNLARLALDHGVERFIYVGSGFEYKHREGPIDESAPLEPANFYGATKAAASILLDQLCRADGLPLITFRPFSVYGPWENAARFVPYVVTKALRGESIALTECVQIRDYLYVEDVVQGFMTGLSDNARFGEVYNLGAGPEGATAIRKVVEIVLELTGNSIELAKFGAVKQVRPEPSPFIADIRKVKDHLGWTPQVKLEDGLARIVEWYRSNSLD